MKQIAGIDTNRLKLLLVDDIPLNLILLDKMLKPYEFQIVKTNNGREALEQIQAVQDTPEAFDLAIVDIMMPEIDGYQVLEYVRRGCPDGQFNITPKTKEEFPVIILSGMNFSDDVAKGMSLGANQFLTKPVVMERLYAAVNEELEMKIQAVGASFAK